MNQVIPIEFDGEIVYVEAETAYGYEDTTSAKEHLATISGAFTRARETISQVCMSMVRTVKAMDKEITPNEFQVQFGIKFGGEAGVMLASVSSEATLTITMTYKH